ncbi:DUF4442 domain-containing protein [Hydrotalea sp.]|uniref:DUF4442 domain-containing protein n=1 Tax=Hydrotalea sp. TaxID=2881279 RepID=UPI00262B0967|nr:DUF4442 domain-containing protein [Hydrotalea sp.]
MVASSFKSFQQKIKHPVLYRLFLLKNLPMAFIAGLGIQQFNDEKALVNVSYRYVTKNPFRSIYFAVLSMAAELSTGILAFANIYQQPVKISMLVVNMQAQFFKKATGVIQFTCDNGLAIQAAIQKTITTNEAITLVCESTGRNQENEVVAYFTFTWSFKRK